MSPPRETKVTTIWQDKNVHIIIITIIIFLLASSQVKSKFNLNYR